MKINPYELLEYRFCPRFIYFMRVLNIDQYEERRYKVQKGRDVHEKRSRENPDYLWKKIGAVQRESNVYLASDRYHLQGIVDEVVTLKDGSMAPIDYKYALRPTEPYASHRLQLQCYCLLVEDVYQEPVQQGFLFYIRRGRDQVAVPFNETIKDKLLHDIETVVKIIQKERMPSPTRVKTRCADCTYKNICVR